MIEACLGWSIQVHSWVQSHLWLGAALAIASLWTVSYYIEQVERDPLCLALPFLAQEVDDGEC